MLRFLGNIVIVLGFIGLFWLAGFAGFVYYVDQSGEAGHDRMLEPMDAIVVLTGGSERISTGINLLQQGLGKKLFISGVGHGVDRAKILAGQTLAAERQSCCVVLGYLAGNTTGNAAETVIWLNQQKYSSLRLVTANYHMLRSLLEFRILDPTLTILPYPVAPTHVMVNTWWNRPGTARLLMIEYNKLLFTALRYCLRDIA
ncbi:MAG: YdcF family protein [Alphaproteobacteria bacterium]